MTDLRKAAQQALEALNRSDYLGWQFNIPIIKALRAALAEPVQEQPTCDECGKSKRDGWALYCVDCLEPVFAQRKPLTEEEIRDLWSWAMTAEAERTATTQQHAFARAIERAHGI